MQTTHVPTAYALFVHSPRIAQDRGMSPKMEAKKIVCLGSSITCNTRT